VKPDHLPRPPSDWPGTSHAAGTRGRGDAVGEFFLDLGRVGAAGPSGFLVPQSDPQHKPELIERYSFGWCHGPAGDAQVFRLLGAVTAAPAWQVPADRCWHTVTGSGLPLRVRPGFWDNSGRCCGTARRAIRDSKNPDGPNLIFTPGEWAAFTQRVKDGDLC
jgi:hypothetical protein